MNEPISIAKNLTKHIKKCKCGCEVGLNKTFFCGAFDGYVEYFIHCRNCGMETERFDNPVAAVTAWNGGFVMHWKDRCINNLLACLEARE